MEDLFADAEQSRPDELRPEELMLRYHTAPIACHCRGQVDLRTDNGELRKALELSQEIPSGVIDSLVKQSSNRVSLRGQYVLNGEVRLALYNAGWTLNQIDMLLYRSMHDHDPKEK